MSAPWIWDGCRWVLPVPDPPPLPSDGPFLPLVGGTMLGPLILAADPASPMAATTMQWVQEQLAGYLPLTGGTVTGSVIQQGVTDGSDVQPGQVGEVIHLVLFDVPFTAARQEQSLTMGTLPPGDWDLMGGMALKSGYLHSFNAQILPLPDGFYSPMNLLAQVNTSDGAGGTLFSHYVQLELASTYTRALTSSSNTLIYQVTTNAEYDGAAGTFDISVMGRRMR